MKLTQIRNATLKITYGGTRFLIDPMLSEQHSWPGFAGTARAHLRNPLVGLPLPLAEILDVDVVIITHTHEDHWDAQAQALLAKDQCIYTQHAQDAALLQQQGFTRVQILGASTVINGITVHKTAGQHGSDAAYAIPAVAARLGEACGVVMQHPDEPTLYLAGDTVWVPACRQVLAQWQPGVVVLNAGDARVDEIGPIIMGKEDLLRVHQTCPGAAIVASHMEAINHCLLSRAELREYTRAQGISAKVWIPADGETLDFGTGH